MKTIRVQSNGLIKEAMSFENIDYLEVAECENWYDSSILESLKVFKLMKIESLIEASDS